MLWQARGEERENPSGLPKRMKYKTKVSQQ